MTTASVHRHLTVVAASVAVLSAGMGSALTSSGNDGRGDRPIPTPFLVPAEQAALEETGEGRVTGSESGDEESMYEVEVTLEDGSQVDVQLDASFQVVDVEVDGADQPSE